MPIGFCCRCDQLLVHGIGCGAADEMKVVVEVKELAVHVAVISETCSSVLNLVLRSVEAVGIHVCLKVVGIAAFSAVDNLPNSRSCQNLIWLWKSVSCGSLTKNNCEA